MFCVIFFQYFIEIFRAEEDSVSLAFVSKTIVSIFELFITRKIAVIVLKSELIIPDYGGDRSSRMV